MRWTERGQWAVIIVVVYATLLPTLEHLKCVISFSLCKNQRLSNGGRTYAIDRSFYTISDKKRAFPPHSWESTHLYNLPTLESWIQTLCNMVSACSGLDIELYHWSCCIPIFGGCITMVLGCINVITLGIIFVQSYGGSRIFLWEFFKLQGVWCDPGMVIYMIVVSVRLVGWKDPNFLKHHFFPRNAECGMQGPKRV